MVLPLCCFQRQMNSPYTRSWMAMLEEGGRCTWQCDADAQFGGHGKCASLERYEEMGLRELECGEHGSTIGHLGRQYWCESQGKPCH